MGRARTTSIESRQRGRSSAFRAGLGFPTPEYSVRLCCVAGAGKRGRGSPVLTLQVTSHRVRSAILDRMMRGCGWALRNRDELIRKGGCLPEANKRFILPPRVRLEAHQIGRSIVAMQLALTICVSLGHNWGTRESRANTVDESSDYFETITCLACLAMSPLPCKFRIHIRARHALPIRHRHAHARLRGS